MLNPSLTNFTEQTFQSWLTYRMEDPSNDAAASEIGPKDGEENVSTNEQKVNEDNSSITNVSNYDGRFSTSCIAKLPNVFC